MLSNIAPLVTALRYQSIDDDGLIHLDDGALGVVLEVMPSLGLTDDMSDRLLQLLLKQLPDNTVLQVCLSACPYLGESLADWQGAQVGRESLCVQAARRRAQFASALESPMSGFGASCRRFQGWLGLVIPGGRDAATLLLQTKAAFLQELETLGLGARAMSANALLGELRTTLNVPSALSPVDGHWDDIQALKDQIISPGTLWQQTSTSMVAKHRDWQVTPLALTRQPTEFDGNSWTELCGQLFNESQQLGSPFSYHVTLVKKKQRGDKARAEMGFKRAEKAMRFTWLTKLNPNLGHAFHDWRYTNEKIQSGNDALVEVMISAQVGSSQKTHAANISRFQAVGAACGFEWQPSTGLALPLMLAQCPLMLVGETLAAWEKLGRFKTTLASSAVHLLPLSAPNSGPLIGMPLVGRRGELFGFDNFNPKHRNFNVAVTGASGAGKSVFIQELIARNLSQPKRRVFVLDIGRSYETLCQVLGGQYVDFNHQKPQSLNPFSGLTLETWIEHKSQLVNLLMAMVGLNPTGHADSLTTFISQSLNAGWQHHQSGLTFTHLMQLWQSHTDARMHELALRLQPFTKDGDYGAWFEPPSDVNFKKDFIVLELENLKPHPRLLPIIVMMLMSEITHTMYRGKSRGEKVMCVIDEAWDLFKADSFASFIEEGYRRARKYNGSFVAGTQSLMDFAASNATRALIKNADQLVLLSQDANDYQLAVDAKIIAPPSAYERRLVESLKTRKGVFAECLIQAKQGGSQLGRLVLDSFSSALYATDAERFNAIRENVANGMTWTTAVMQLAKEDEV